MIVQKVLWLDIAVAQGILTLKGLEKSQSLVDESSDLLQFKIPSFLPADPNILDQIALTFFHKKKQRLVAFRPPLQLSLVVFS